MRIGVLQWAGGGSPGRISAGFLRGSPVGNIQQWARSRPSGGARLRPETARMPRRHHCPLKMRRPMRTVKLSTLVLPDQAADALWLSRGARSSVAAKLVHNPDLRSRPVHSTEVAVAWIRPTLAHPAQLPGQPGEQVGRWAALAIVIRAMEQEPHMRRDMQATPRISPSASLLSFNGAPAGGGIGGARPRLA